MPTQELAKPKIETGPAVPEITGEGPEISNEELDRILGMDQDIVAADKQRLENLRIEIPALLEETKAGALERGESQRLLGEVAGAEKSLEYIFKNFMEETAGQIEPLPAAEIDEPAAATLDISGEAGELDAVEAEYLRAIAEEQEARAGVSASLKMPRASGEDSGAKLAEVEAKAAPLAGSTEAKAEPAPKPSAEDRLNQAREFLVAAEKVDKKKNTPEYAAFLKEYQEARAEAVGGKVEAWLEEQIKLVEARAQEKSEGKKWLGKGYDAYKKLGEWNLGALLKSDEKLRTQEGDAKTLRILKGIGRFATRTVSVRTALSSAMLGAGLYFGAGAAVGAAAIAGRRAFSGLGAGIGSYDLMKMFSDKRAAGEMGMRKNLTAEEADGLTDEQLVERMSYFEAHAALNGSQIGENETYRLLQDRLTERTVSADLDGLMMEKDSQLAALTARAKAKDNKMKIAGAVVGAVVGSGLLYRGIGAIKEYLTGPKELGAAELPKPGVKAAVPYIDVDNPAVGTTPEVQVVAGAEAGTIPATVAEIKPAAIAATDTVGVKLKDLNIDDAPEAPVKHGVLPTAETPPKPDIQPAGKALDAAVAPKGTEAAMAAKAAPIESPSPKHFEYQGGKSVWNELAKQYEKRWPGFDKLPKAEQTYLIDQVKDKIVAHHGELGLADIDHVQASEMKAVDWDKVFSDAKMESPHLSPVQIANIDHPPVQEPAAAIEQPMAAKVPEDVLEAQKFPEVEIKPTPETAVDESMLAQQNQPEVEIPGQNSATAVAAETTAPAAFEKTAQALLAEKLHQNWTPEKLKTFMYLHEAEAARLSGKPDLLQSKLQEFNKLTQDLTERVKTGSLKDTGLTGAQAAHGAKGETFLLQQAGKDKWRIWQVQEGNQVQSIVEQKRGLLGLGKKNVDIFDSKRVKEVLGYTAEPKGAAAAQELAFKSKGAKGQPPF